MNDFDKTFKFKASVLFAIISFLIVAIAGLLRDVRFATIAWRSLLAFFIAGCAAYLIVFILEFKGIINFDVLDAEEEIAEVQEEKSDNKGKKTEDEAAKNDGQTAKDEGSGGFKPLNADNLEKIAS